MAASITEFVRVTARVAAAGTVRRDFGRTLLLRSPDTTLAGRTDPDAVARDQAVRVYAGASAMAADYPSSRPDADATLAAQTYFGQEIFPRNLLVGSIWDAGAPPFLVGGPPGAISAIQALTALVVNINGADTASMNFAGAADLNAVAGILQGALDLVAAGTTVTAVDGRLAVSEPVGAEIVFAQTAGTDTLGLTGGGETLYPSIAAESASDALTRIQALDDTWYTLALTNDLADTDIVPGAAAWIAANGKMLALDSYQTTGADSALAPNETASYAAQLFATQTNRAYCLVSASRDHKALALAARFSGTDFRSVGTVTTGKFKVLAGTAPDAFDGTQRAELERKRVNHYVEYGPGGDARTAQGTLFSGGWIDSQIWVDWFRDALETELYNLLTRASRVSFTEAGIGTIQEVVEGICEEGIRNGGIAPGQLSPPLAADVRRVTGNGTFDGFLTTGYLVHIPTAASQPQSARDARTAPPASVWVKGSGAIHELAVDVTFEE